MDDVVRVNMDDVVRVNMDDVVRVNICELKFNETKPNQGVRDLVWTTS